MFYNENDTLMWGKLQAVKHANGRDWWMISKKQKRNVLLEWLITPDSIYGPTQISYNGNTGIDSYFTQASISQNGDKYAIIHNDKFFQLFNFDRCTGAFNLIFNEQLYDSIGYGGGVAFSPTGQYLYATTGIKCWQFDLNSSSVFNSKKIIAVYDGFMEGLINCDFSTCRLAPDGKIYITPLSTNTYWTRINYPDLTDTLAEVEQHVVNLYCYNNVSFPNLPNFNLGALSMSSCDTLTEINKNKIENISLYPNPAGEYLILEESFNDFYYEIYDLTGIKIFSETKINNRIISIDKLQNGLYLLKLKDGLKNIKMMKFIKMKID
jgi:hypothetical protein